MAKKKSATATKRKTPSPRAARKAAGVEVPPEKTGGTKADIAPNQPPIAGMEDTDERIPELEELCQSVLSMEEKRKSLKIDRDEALESIGDLLTKKDLNLYICNGQKFFVEPGSPQVKHKKVNQAG